MNKKIIQKCTFATITLLFCLFSSLVFSKSAHALDLASFAKPTGNRISFQGGICNVTNADNSKMTNFTINSYQECGYFTQNDETFSQAYANSVRALIAGQSYTFKKDYIYEGFILVKNRNTSGGIGSAFTPHKYFLDNPNFVLLNAEQIVDSEIYQKQYCTVYDTQQYQDICRGDHNFSWKNWKSQLYRYTFYVTDDVTGVLTLGRYQDLETSFLELYYESKLWISDVVEYQQTTELDQAEQKTEEATDEGQQNSDSAATDNEQASQNLLQTAGDIISAFSSPATNCSISGDLGNVDLGNLNFCQDKPSAIINAMDAIASIIVAFMVFRIIKRLIGRFTSLSAYGQGGSDG